MVKDPEQTENQQNDSAMKWRGNRFHNVRMRFNISENIPQD